MFLRQRWEGRFMPLAALVNHWAHGLLKGAFRSAGKLVVDMDILPVSIKHSYSHIPRLQICCEYYNYVSYSESTG